ncbi:hypothetical protein ACM66B_000031 [Microbotryomycetes sp. NB124-2]
MAASVSNRPSTNMSRSTSSNAVGTVPLSISGAAAATATTSSTLSSTVTNSNSSNHTLDPSKWTYKKLSNGHRSQVRCVAWNCDGRRLASGAQDGTLRVWQPDKDSRSSVEYRGHTGDVSLVRWNPVHPERFASCSATASDKSLHFWDMREGNRPTYSVTTEGENIQMVWSPDGKTIVVSSRRDIMTWIDVDTRQVIKKWDVGKETNESIFSHDGRILFMAVDGYAVLTSFPQGDDIHRVHVSPAAVTVLDLDPKGRYLAAGSTDATVTLWDTREWTCAASAGFHDDPPRVVRFCADGQYVASACGDKEVVISRVPTLTTVTTLTTGGAVDSLSWHPTKNVLAFSSSEDVGGVRLWGAGL